MLAIHNLVSQQPIWLIFILLDRGLPPCFILAWHICHWVMYVLCGRPWFATHNIRLWSKGGEQGISSTATDSLEVCTTTITTLWLTPPIGWSYTNRDPWSSTSLGPRKGMWQSIPIILLQHHPTCQPSVFGYMESFFRALYVMWY